MRELIDNMTERDHFPWMVSDYLDCGKYGILNNRGQIVVGFGAALSQRQLQTIVDVANGIAGVK